MDLVNLNEVTAEVIDYINENMSKNKGLLGLIKLSGSLKDASDEEIKAAQKEFKQKIKDAGYKLENKKYIPISAEKITDNLEIKEVEKVEVQTKSKRGRKTKAQKELEKQKENQVEYQKNHPFGNMKDDLLIGNIYRHAKEVRGTEKAVGINLYNTVAEKFKYLEEAYFLINNNIIMDTLINIFIEKHNNEYTEGFEQELLKILHTEKKNKKQVTYVLSEDTNKKLEQLINEKFEHYSKTEFINLVMLSCSERFIIENEKESTVE